VAAAKACGPVRHAEFELADQAITDALGWNGSYVFTHSDGRTLDINVSGGRPRSLYSRTGSEQRETVSVAGETMSILDYSRDAAAGRYRADVLRGFWTWEVDGAPFASKDVYLVTALVVGQLAVRLRRNTREAARLATEQAALRRVATLVAQSAPSSEVFDAVTREVGLLCEADLARMERYETDGTVTGVAVWSQTAGELAVGTRFALVGVSVAASVLEAGSPVRIDTFTDARGPIAEEARSTGIRSSVGCPIVVNGSLWG
jgi:hypothetical protein